MSTSTRKTSIEYLQIISEGSNAFCRGEAITTCPYATTDEGRDDWRSGWINAANGAIGKIRDACNKAGVPAQRTADAIAEFKELRGIPPDQMEAQLAGVQGAD